MKEKWERLASLAKAIQAHSLNDLFENDPTRVDRFSLEAGDIYLDYSKHFITEDIRAALVALAQDYRLSEAIQRLLKGEKVNQSENRAAWHTALRLENPPAQVLEQKEKMAVMVEALQTGKWRGTTGKAITDVVNLGIGGSDLGPRMAVEALKTYSQSELKIHFVSNIDPLAISECLASLNPATTLFILSSKSFTTQETLINAEVAKAWLSVGLKTQNVENHFIAVTASPEKAKAWGAAHILSFWEWVGGRYSIWSTIGLPLALQIGTAHFEEFLEGARKMDEHFATAPFAENMPILLGLIGIWYIHFWEASSIAVLPYTQALRQLPDYLQQLDMESNGKSRTFLEQPVDYKTGPIVWGQAGTNGQHAFYQLLHQGTHFVPIDFIALAKSPTDLKSQHQILLAHCFAQAQALMQGDQKTFPGNKPSSMLLLRELTPRSLGQLLALYEHKVFVQGIIWQINSFDQPGVELGKKLAAQVQNSLEKGDFYNVDPSTRSLVNRVRLIDK